MPAFPGASSHGAITAAEIASQPRLWPKAVNVGIAATSLQQLLISGTTAYIGCGSTAHLARALAVAHRQSLPTVAWAAAASEMWLAPRADPLGADTVVAVSRSGETTETLEACMRARGADSRIVAVTTNPASSLSTIADGLVSVEFAAEESVVQTRSFTSMLIAALAAQLSAAGRDADAVFAGIDIVGEFLMEIASPTIARLSDPSLEAIYVLGSGLDHGLAHEGALKIKEMSRTFTEAMPVLDFRHGPISLADERSAALVLCGPGLHHELAAAADIEACGAYVATVGPDRRCTVETAHGTSAHATAVARLVIPQLAGLRRGIAKGLNPDAPRALPAYVEL